MRNVQVERTVAAPRSSVWAVLADYPDIADSNDGVMKSYALGEETQGVGARRQCELAPKGTMQMRETVTEWVADEKMVIDIDRVEKLPIKKATMTFTLSDRGGTTQFRMSYDFEPKGGPLALLYGPMLDTQLFKGFNGFVDNLEVAAQARTTA